MKRNYSETQVNRFKVGNLFGIEQEAEVVALAIVNMIFRGDGKNNIQEGNCFQWHLVRQTPGRVEWSKMPPRAGEEAVTKVLMNPPFALKSSDEREYKFVEHALRQMEQGGMLFSVMPYSAMAKPGSYQRWRSGMLRRNALVCVLTLPDDLFYPVGVHTVGVFIKKGIPHPKDQNVLWVRAICDGHLKSRGKRLPNARARDDYARVRNTVKAFLGNPSIDVPNEEQFQKACPIDFEDPLLELVPENYLDQSAPSDAEIRDGIEQVLRDAVAFLIRARKEDG